MCEWHLRVKPQVQPMVSSSFTRTLPLLYPVRTTLSVTVQERWGSNRVPTLAKRDDLQEEQHLSALSLLPRIHRTDIDTCYFSSYYTIWKLLKYTDGIWIRQGAHVLKCQARLEWRNTSVDENPLYKLLRITIKHADFSPFAQTIWEAITRS